MMKKLLIGMILSAFAIGFAAKPEAAELAAISKKVNPPAGEARKELPDIFPVGFFHGDACLLVNASNALKDPVALRRAKTFHDLAKRYVNVILPSNARYRVAEMDVAAKYGMYVIPSLNLLHGVGKEKLTAADGEALQKIRDQWKIEVDRLGKHPALLAWHIYDEPMPWFSRSLLNIRSFLREYDGKHPVVYTHQNLPLGFDKSEWELLASEPVIFSDCYSINKAMGRDPWLYGDVGMRDFRRVNPNADYWPIIQSYTYHYEPTPGELRIMVYHTLARGAKGMFFFTTGQSVVSWANSEKIGFYDSPGNLWFASDILLNELGRISEHLMTAGPLLLPLTYTDKYQYKVHNQDTITAYVTKKGLRPDDMLKVPVIDIGAFTGKDYDILVIHNDDPNYPRSAEITLPASQGKNELFDLRTLEKVKSKTSDKGEKVYCLSFVPGDGGLYFYGNDQNFEAARNSVLQRRFKQELLLLNLDMEIAEINSVDVSEVKALIGKTGGETPEKALSMLADARNAFLMAEAATGDYYENKKNLELMRSVFSDMDIYLSKCPAKWDDMTVETREFITRLLDLTRQFTAFENQFRSGKADPAAGRELLLKVEQLNQKRPQF